LQFLKQGHKVSAISVKLVLRKIGQWLSERLRRRVEQRLVEIFFIHAIGRYESSAML